MNALYVTCPWCRSQFANPVTSNCPNCGGALPIIGGSDAGQAPPPAPRILPRKYVRGVKYTGNVYTMIGIIFTIPFFWTILFPIIGIILWRKGLREADAELIPLQDGAHVQGEIVAVDIDYSKTLNGRHPRVVQFMFQANGRSYAGDVPNVMDPVELWRKPGDRVWVVYMPQDPDTSSIWPPLK